jgi:hypothetical protein
VISVVGMYLMGSHANIAVEGKCDEFMAAANMLLPKTLYTMYQNSRP